MSVIQKLLYVAAAVATFAGLYLFDQSTNQPAIAGLAEDSAILSFVESQNRQLRDAIDEQSHATQDIPAAKIELTAAACSVMLTSKAWIDLTPMRARLEQTYSEVAAALADDSALSTPQPMPEPELPSNKIDLLEVDTLQRFDLRNFDLSAVTVIEREGIFIGIAKQLPFSGGDDPTNQRFVAAHAATAKTEKEAAGIRKFGQLGRSKLKLSFGDEANPAWQHRRDTFLTIADVMRSAGDATNIAITAGYKVGDDGARSIATGEISQPKEIAIYGTSEADVRAQAANLRAWKAQTCR